MCEKAARISARGVRCSRRADFVRRRHQRKRVDRHITKAHRPMQMRPGDAARRTGLAQHLSAGNGHAGFDVDSREMRQQGEHTETMVDDHGVAREIQTLRHDNASGVGRSDRRARCRAEVSTLMTAGRLAIGHSQSPKATRRHARNWRVELPVPEALVRHDGKCFRHRLRFLLDALDLILRRVRKFRVDSKPTRLELVALHEQGHACCSSFPVQSPGLNCERKWTWRRLHADSGETIPFPGGRSRPEVHAAPDDLTSELRQILRGLDSHQGNASRLQWPRDVDQRKSKWLLAPRLCQAAGARGEQHRQRENEKRPANQGNVHWASQMQSSAIRMSAEEPATCIPSSSPFG